MLNKVSKATYREHFPQNPHLYISDAFIELVKNKVDEVIYLMNVNDPFIGLVAGIKDNLIMSPFSAPFGGVHYSHEHVGYELIEDFVNQLKMFIQNKHFKGINITLPPDIYQTNINAKLINALLRNDFSMELPDIVNWIQLKSFDGKWSSKKVSNRVRKAIRSNLSFDILKDVHDKNEAYELIVENRRNLGRDIHMSFQDLQKINEIIPVDFFSIKDPDKKCVGAGVFYRAHDKIAQGIFMGDDTTKRDLGIIDFLYDQLYEYYKFMNYEFIDFGISTEKGQPNAGLIRFKEIHNCQSSLRFTLTWSLSK